MTVIARSGMAVLNGPVPRTAKGSRPAGLMIATWTSPARYLLDRRRTVAAEKTNGPLIRPLLTQTDARLAVRPTTLINQLGSDL